MTMPARRPASDIPTVMNPAQPDRVCWGCERYCPAGELACGNGAIRTPHPKELFGEDWLAWSNGAPGPTRPPRG
jgi:hypothetical protein